MDTAPSTNIYRNLHKQCWSIKAGKDPVVHAPAVHALNVRFVVQPAGRARVRREHKKYVHAFVRTTEWEALGASVVRIPDGWVLLQYNPYRDLGFNDGYRYVVSARAVLLTADGRLFADEPVRVNAEDIPR
jgi:hypothetical protein